MNQTFEIHNSPSHDKAVRLVEIFELLGNGAQTVADSYFVSWRTFQENNLVRYRSWGQDLPG